jgi:heme-degrading monooxygenase HmoA
MIARVWRGVAPDRASADAYVRHLVTNVLPALSAIQGHRGVRVLERQEGNIEVLVMTFWDSMDAIRRFAGPDTERAVVEPEARALLTQYDAFVRHYTVYEPS